MKIGEVRAHLGRSRLPLESEGILYSPVSE